MAIKGFRELSMMDWDGVVSSILFLGGCNFRCLYCHNHEIAFHPEGVESIPEEVVLTRLDELKDWIEGVVISGGEPTIYGDRLLELIKRIRERGFKVKLYTNGSNPKLLSKIIDEGLVSAVSMDIKHVLSKYKSVVMSDKKDITDSVGESLEILKSTHRIPVKFRLTVVKGIHSPDDVLEIKGLVSPKPLILQNVSVEHVPEGYRELIKPFPAEDFNELQKTVCGDKRVWT